MQAKYAHTIDPMWSPIIGTIPLPGEDTYPATPPMPPYHSPAHGSHLGLYPHAPSPAPSAASTSSTSSRSSRSHMSNGHGYGNPNKQLSPLHSPTVKVITTPPMTLYATIPPSPKDAQSRPAHARVPSRTYPAHAPLPHQTYPYTRPPT
ncbi:hypothetical protein OE88DRAFT_895136 [Heliocybe sulcata]|uniref:Uncharacterized protein n=1 Tax=Heliocybe sulcata TaxID=5364 RepID=A0A5C3MM48_9AGAM|nr:hypothetical protein OE88DRAFT_895136 [Heliocybe sulcata]